MNKGIKTASVISIIAIAIVAGCTGPTPGADISAKSADWCVKGTTSEVELPGGTQTTEIIGVVNYEGREVCQAVMKTEDTTTTYYASPDSTYLHTVVTDSTGKVIYESGQKSPKR